MARGGIFCAACFPSRAGKTGCVGKPRGLIAKGQTASATSYFKPGFSVILNAVKDLNPLKIRVSSLRSE
jgi:hypothetical protein